MLYRYVVPVCTGTVPVCTGTVPVKDTGGDGTHTGTGGNEARISTAVGAPTGAAVPVRLYQEAVRASSAEAAASYSVRTREAL